MSKRSIAFFTFSFLFGLTQIHAADLGKQIMLSEIKVTGRDVMNAFALQCGDETFKTFANWARKTNYSNKKIEVADKTATMRGNSIIYDSGVEINVVAHNKIELKSQGKKTVGADLCDLFMKANAGGRISAANDSFSIFNRAWADDEKIKSSNYIGKTASALVTIAGAAAVGTGVVVASPVVIVGGVGALIYGGYQWLNSGYNDAANKKFETILNSKFEIICDTNSMMTIQGAGYKILVNKQPKGIKVVPAGYAINVYSLGGAGERTKLEVDSEDNYAPGNRKLISTWAEQCNNPQDAMRLNEELAASQAAARQRVEAFSNRGSYIDNAVDRATGTK